jgi:hypothetical protein
MDTIELTLRFDDLAPDDLRAALVLHQPEIGECAQFLVRPARALRSPSLDTSVLVAIVTGGSATISALVMGLLRIVESKRLHGHTIVIRGSSGRRIEVPDTMPISEIRRVAQLAAELDGASIRVERRG